MTVAALNDDWDPVALEAASQERAAAATEDALTAYLRQRRIRVAPERVTGISDNGVVVTRPKASTAPYWPPPSPPFNLVAFREIRLAQKQGLLTLRRAQWLLEQCTGIPLPPTRLERLLAPAMWLVRRWHSR